MTDLKVFAVSAALGAALAVGIAGSPPAHAADWALNGTYLATSNGDMAQTNDVYRDEATVRSTWTINMTCTVNVLTCAGRVDSDAGWSADIATTGSEYIVKRDLPNWEPCADGSGRTVTGHQRYRFFPVNEAGFVDPASRTFAGYDRTSGESGGCSLNDKLEIDLPFRLDKIN